MEDYFFPNLNPMEREILGHLKDGLTNEEIAQKMYISPKTVAKHLTELLAKTGLKNRTQLAITYYKYTNGNKERQK